MYVMCRFNGSYGSGRSYLFSAYSVPIQCLLFFQEYSRYSTNYTAKAFAVIANYYFLG